MGKVFERIAYCECGCGQRVKPGTRFVKGHHVKVPGRKNSDETRQKMSESAYNRKPWVPRQCECGCGQWVNKYRRFISGHNTRVKQIGFTWNNEHRKNHAAAMKGRVFSDAGKEKIREIRQRDFNNPEYASKVWKKIRQTQGIRPNKDESRLLQILNEIYPSEWKYTGDLSVRVGRKNPDFMHVKEDLIVELFGEYWHRGQDPKDREEYFMPFGYRTLVIWNKELDDLESTKEKIIDFVENYQ